MIRFLTIALLTCFSQMVSAQSISRSLQGIEMRPFGRMIRICCNFGYDLPVFGYPAHMGYIGSLETLGKHKFYGNESEGNGIIYTRDAGFFDLGHVRDNADMVAYFAWEISRNLGTDFIIETSREGGKRELKILLDSVVLSHDDILVLAQRITYEFAVWHEIRTYFGVPTHFPIHEMQSAFSPEDHYSNLLGSYVGRWALEEEGLFESNVDSVIDKLLLDLGAVKTFNETKAAMDSVHGLWWRRVSVPSNKLLLTRNTKAYGTIDPWLIPSHKEFFRTPTKIHSLTVPTTTPNGKKLEDLFVISINPVPLIPLKKIFGKGRKIVTQKDYPAMIRWIEKELELTESKL